MARQTGTDAANGSGGSSAGRTEPNAKFNQTSFLYGGNAAYVEQLQADFERDPNSVDPEWRAFFAQLGDDRAAVETSASGPHWRKPNWPVAANGELISALDGDWAKTTEGAKPGARPDRGAKPELAGKPADGAAPADVQRATRDSVRALMMIRAYRMRGHLHARSGSARHRTAKGQ